VFEDELAATWQRVREQLRASVTASTFDHWLKHLRPVAIRERRLYLTAPDRVLAWAQKRYSVLIRDALREQTGLEEVSLVSPNTIDGESPSGACGGAARATLNPDYRFERFVIGAGNRFAHAAALQVAESPGEAYNPLFLHGPPGLGKTHLLVAIANYLRDRRPDLSVHYTTAECFTTEFVSALRSSGVEAFKERHRDIDVLLIDDVQFLESKRHTEEEFFHTFNVLHESGSQIVLSSDRLPRELAKLADRLRDRFEWGLVASLSAPDRATCLAVLARLAKEGGVIVPDPGALPAVAAVAANVRQLEGALNRALAYSSLMGRPLTAGLIGEILPRSRGAEAAPATPIERIQHEVAEEYGISTAQLIGRERRAGISAARGVALHLARELTDLSLPRIGASFGGRDHSTVLSAIRRTRAQIDANDVLGDRVHRISERIGSMPAPVA
jgi:chromosomal replication initiator protein